jgi:hypothetical protein
VTWLDPATMLLQARCPGCSNLDLGRVGWKRGRGAGKPLYTTCTHYILQTVTNLYPSFLYWYGTVRPRSLRGSFSTESPRLSEFPACRHPAISIAIGHCVLAYPVFASGFDPDRYKVEPDQPFGRYFCISETNGSP